MSYFGTYSPYALDYGNSLGIPQQVTLGLFQQESSWNPFASNSGSSAYGPGQLTTAAAAAVGVNPYNPIQNIQGSLQYLASMPGTDWTTKLAHYFQGPNATITNAGISYANSVLAKGKSLLGSIGSGLNDVFGTGNSNSLVSWGKSAAQAAACYAGDPTACAGAVGAVLGGPSSWIDELKDWIASSGFFQRIALALVALLLILGAIYTLKGKAT